MSRLGSRALLEILHCAGIPRTAAGSSRRTGGAPTRRVAARWGNPRRSLTTTTGAYSGRPYDADTVPHRSRGEVPGPEVARSEEHTSELQSREKLVCRLLLEK